MVNEELIKQKIGLIQNEMLNLEKLSAFSFEEIISDFMKQYALERILEKIIHRAIDINQHLIAELSEEEPPGTYKETFLKLAELKICPLEFAKNISRSVGTRNMLIHEYDEVDYGKIYSSINDCLKDYYQYCDYMLKFLEKIKDKK